jgi:hypothetical protein
MKTNTIQNWIHLDPDLVVTTAPPTALPVMGDVVTGAPSSNAGLPEITPVIEPSRACFHLDMTGTPRGALEAGVAEAVEESPESDLPPPNPNKLIVTPLMFAFKNR